MTRPLLTIFTGALIGALAMFAVTPQAEVRYASACVYGR